VVVDFAASTEVAESTVISALPRNGITVHKSRGDLLSSLSRSILLIHTAFWMPSKKAKKISLLSSI
jgi:hypothetical protein